jgi:uncharacterized protein YqeY
MALLERIAEDMKTAMKAGQKLRLETLRTVRAGLQEKQVEKRPSGGMTGDDEIAVLNSALKKRKEASTIFRANGRADLADQEDQEAEIIIAYLPQQLSAADVEETVRRIIAAAGAVTSKDFGKIMPAAMKELKGKADGKLVQETVKKLLKDE